MLYCPPRASFLIPGCGAELGLEQSCSSVPRGAGDCPQGPLPVSPKLRMGSGQGGVTGAHKLMLESTAGRGRSGGSQQQTGMHPWKKRPRLILYPLPISAEQHLLHQGGQLRVERDVVMAQAQLFGKVNELHLGFVLVGAVRHLEELSRGASMFSGMHRDPPTASWPLGLPKLG